MTPSGKGDTFSVVQELCADAFISWRANTNDEEVK